jgi:hypothetical protein
MMKNSKDSRNANDEQVLEEWLGPNADLSSITPQQRKDLGQYAQYERSVLDYMGASVNELMKDFGYDKAQESSAAK